MSDLDERDIRFDVTTSGVNIAGTVKVTHLPTGATAESTAGRSTLQNKAEALRLLDEMLSEATFAEQHYNPRLVGDAP